MFGRRRGSETASSAGSVQTLELALPPTAGVLSCRVAGPQGELLRQARYEVTDPIGRLVLRGQTDPFGCLIATVPAGPYRIEISAEGYAAHAGGVQVSEDGPAEPAEIVLQSVDPPLLPAPGHWEMEPTHSAIRFTAHHTGLARLHGRFNTFAGAVRIADHMESSSIQVIIDAAGIDTGFHMRDEYLRSHEFLDAVRQPRVEFHSERFIHRGGTRWAVPGTLTLRGVSRSVTLDTEYLGLGSGSDGEPRAACRASVELQRADYGLIGVSAVAQGMAAMGPSIMVELDIQIVRKG
ncbi:YceI family protein [Streptomyces sp. NPDC006879]|uniref:YceI family protein n=1 Tax=Streptomyces sp. NPDC006879 TaxID=3364767 RepID=UPI003674EE0B